MLAKLLSIPKSSKGQQRQANQYRDLIRAEAVIGGQIFGDLPEGHRREFFCLDEHTWIWHEEWVDMIGRRNIRTTRYDVRPNAILKAQDGAGYQALTEAEARNFVAAVRIYKERVLKELYHVDPKSV